MIGRMPHTAKSSKRSSFLVLSKEGEIAARIVRQLRTNPFYDVIYESSPKLALERMATETLSCLILNLDQFGFRQYHMIEQIRSLNYKFQILIFADTVMYAAEEVVEKMHDVVIFGKSFIDVDADLLGICTRFAEGAGSVKRNSKRKSTHQKAMALNLRTGHRFSCMAYNMSLGGAYIEFQAHGVHLGDTLNVVIMLSRLKKTHVMKAKVMWVKSARHGALAAGLQFLK
jgi:hypothetical protein